MESPFLNFVRRCIYNRWFYAVLAIVCLLDVITDIINIVQPGESFTLDLLSLIASGVTALLVSVVFVDLQIRRAKR